MLQKQQKGRNYYVSFNSNVECNGINSSIKRNKRVGWNKRVSPNHLLLQEVQLIGKTKNRIRIKGQKKIFESNGVCRQAGVAILI
jgi:DNA phosphorothioation-dependent restriction protein DptG